MRFLEAKRYQSAYVRGRISYFVQLPYAMLNPAKQDLRQQQSRPLLGVIQKQIEAARSAALPGGSLARCGLRRMEPLRFQAGAKLAKEKG